LFHLPPLLFLSLLLTLVFFLILLMSSVSTNRKEYSCQILDLHFMLTSVAEINNEPKFSSILVNPLRHALFCDRNVVYPLT
jgi:hypothetical protein